jgi:hypothetical protein
VKWIAGIGVAVVVIVAAFMALRGDSSNALADAAGRMAGENTRVKISMGVDEAGETYSVTGTGNVAADNSAGEMDAVLGIEGRKLDAQIRNIGDRFWYRIREPEFRQVMPPGKRWVHAVDRTTPATSLSPSEFASFLAEADDVDELEDDVMIRGKPTTHYSGVVDVEDLADEIGGESKERIEAAIEKSDREPGQKVGLPIQAWISRDGLPLRMRIYTQGESSLDMRADILEYGVEVDVEPPPESTVISEAEFNRLTGG